MTCQWQPAPPGWTEYFAGKWPFYVHHATGVKQWQRPMACIPPSHFMPALDEPATFMQTHSPLADRHTDMLEADTAKSDGMGQQSSTDVQHAVSRAVQDEPSLPELVSTSLSRSKSAGRSTSAASETDPGTPNGESLLGHEASQQQVAPSAKQAELSKAKRNRPDSEMEHVQTRPRKVPAAASTDKYGMSKNLAALRCSNQDWAAATSGAFSGTVLAT